MFFFASDFEQPLSSQTLRDHHFLLDQSIMEREKKLELSTNNRQSAFLILWSKQENGSLPRGSAREVADFLLLIDQPYQSCGAKSKEKSMMH